MPTTPSIWDRAAAQLTCPHCSAALRRTDTRLVCPAGHSFDLAKQGYVNLLGRAAPHHADTAAMVAARERFLAAGHYAPITQALAAATPADAEVVVEVGAGTGHHLAALVTTAAQSIGIATDISVAAARRAALVHPRVASVVADTWARIPVADASVDVMACVFAPRQADEFTRVLRPGGRLLVLTPLPGHLASLRAELGLLDIHPDKSELLDRQLANFTELSRERLQFRLQLDAPTVADLVGMGPNAFHQSGKAGEAEPNDLGPASTEAAVELRTLQR